MPDSQTEEQHGKALPRSRNPWPPNPFQNAKWKHKKEAEKGKRKEDSRAASITRPESRLARPEEAKGYPVRKNPMKGRL